MCRLRISVAVALFLLLIAAQQAQAAPPADELKALRDEIAQLKKSYEARISALEAKIAQAVTEKHADDHDHDDDSGAPDSHHSPVSEAAFNPAVSLVLMGTYTRLSQDPNHYAIHGFIPGGNEMGPPKRSFGLGESELGISANIDHRLRGQFTASLSADGDVGVEEAFIQTLALGNGATLKAGRMFSGIGYLNGQHPHAWDFADAPLAYGAFLGSQWKNDGIQAMWVAPTALWIELGGEMGAGGAFPSTDRNKNGNTAGALFAHIGGDAGDSASWRAGLSVLGVSPRDRRYEDVDGLGNPVTNSFSGKSRTWIADAIWKQELAHGGRLIVQGEYFRRRENGTLVWDVDGAGLADGYSATQSGFYAQAVWQFAPLWRVGYRYDRLDSGKADLGSTLNPDDLPMLAAYKPRRNTLMIDFSPSEFSRLRLQLARDQSRRDLTDNQLWLQYIVNLGAHGPHHH